MKIVISIFIALLVSPGAHSQGQLSGPATLAIELLPNPDLDSMVRKHEIGVIVYKKVWDSSTNSFINKETLHILKEGEKAATFHFLVTDSDTFNIVIAVEYKVYNNRSYDEKQKIVSIPNITLQPWKIRKITQQFPQSCSYDKRFFNRICPVCEKTDEVKILVRSWCIMGTPEEFLNDLHVTPERSEDCMPNWYCERDKIEY